MAFGFINWKEDDNSQIIFNAPILLVPVTFENKSSVEPYYIKVIDDDILVNSTFSYKLQNEYGIKLPDYEDEPIGKNIEKISDLVNKLKWSVSTECKIGIFSFLKINMYRDLKCPKNLFRITKTHGFALYRFFENKL